jgi:hypothetical protein
MGADMYGCCTTDQTFLEYTGVKFVSPTQIRGAFTRWTGKHLPELVLTKLRLPSRPAACRSRIVLHIRRGLRRVKVTANGKGLRVRGRSNNRYVVVDLSGSGPHTVVVKVSGLDGKGRVTRRSYRYHRCHAAG